MDLRSKLCLCGNPATQAARDFHEIPSLTPFTEWEALGKLRFGCVDHPVASAEFRIGGLIQYGRVKLDPKLFKDEFPQLGAISLGGRNYEVIQVSFEPPCKIVITALDCEVAGGSIITAFTPLPTSHP